MQPGGAPALPRVWRVLAFCRWAGHGGRVCTVIVRVEPGQVLLAANRDELLDRAWDPPAAWWPERPGVVGGRDRSGGGTWMAINRHGVVATVLNRPGTLGPAAGKRSRGALPLLALEHATAGAAASALTRLDAGSWRGFNMVLADQGGAWFVRGLGYGQPEAAPLPRGVSMVTAFDPNDMESPRTARHLARFRDAEPGWEAWRVLLADRGGAAAEQINVVPRGGFGTVCASFVRLAAGEEPQWLFAAGPPHEAAFRAVSTG
ncbi:MAG TPA: NRDE family protein [Rhodopila sp.]|nr:NRDE family protein [Rhodopila sp.]